ncbi:unnamed protein product, partial [Phaeothamnion confervicola]
SVQVVDEGGGNVRLDFWLDGALYRMVRNIVGYAVAVATPAGAVGIGGGGGIGMAAIAEALETGVRDTNAARSAPAHGLTLERVTYDAYGAPWDPGWG